MATNAKTEGARTPVIDFPAQIQTALARIMGCDGGGLRDLSYRERSLLARLVRNVSIQDPTDSVRVSVSALAEALQTCNKTIQRTFKSLREKGWIDRNQVKKRSGMQIADTWLTSSTLKVLGLVAPSAMQSASDNMSNASRFSTVSKDSQQLTGSSEARAKKSTLPEDVQLLEKKGLSRGAIFKLMGEARQAGHRLGDIVRGATPLIEKARHVFAYMRKLITSQHDWKNYSCAALREQAQETEIRVQREKKSADESLVHTTLASDAILTSAARKMVWMLRDDAVYACRLEDLCLPESKRRYARVIDLVKMADAIRSGKLFAYLPGNEAQT